MSLFFRSLTPLLLLLLTAGRRLILRLPASLLLSLSLVRSRDSHSAEHHATHNATQRSHAQQQRQRQQRRRQESPVSQAARVHVRNGRKEKLRINFFVLSIRVSLSLTRLSCLPSSPALLLPLHPPPALVSLSRLPYLLLPLPPLLCLPEREAHFPPSLDIRCSGSELESRGEQSARSPPATTPVSLSLSLAYCSAAQPASLAPPPSLSVSDESAAAPASLAGLARSRCFPLS